MDDTRSISVTGNLMPTYLDGQPVVARMQNIHSFFVVVFSSEEKLREAMKFLHPGASYKIKHIDDGEDFCESVWEQGIRIMRDPYIVDGCKTHWTEVMKNETC
jgi:hypothetical protein